ncbi:fructose-1,6-bisphosphatase [Saprolegnia parasitica CBS 223.65]|uniref:Fructose-1,6-bisphosphatase, cytosolic n=1 Tax=Saprolegnia parasitica (strain CBS 223.65) TaxID=695850 RepID=A0A067D293_SAPPC|nr:fructose-1,6-bisphosphatase [Saprolegnia parasitica CBS 223.65]KDO33127.1 fructose-1,6-bisphosphatase [Saprolegnia parasitica CBS 223.65]|eukprot:XP_012195894.1 fructose-1,6-bisphosphatase [Saprolegnia parasitica CBS 223.65]
MQVDHSNPITLSRFILADGELQSNNDLCILFNSIELACKVISSAVRRAGLTGLYGLDGSTNSTGDDVKKLDLLSNEIFINSLRNSTKIEVMVSEENEDPIWVEGVSGCKYGIAFDPLDGSSNIDCNISTGTIFAIYAMQNTGPRRQISDILQPGRQLVAAGYCMYGSSTQMVVTYGKGVHGFTLDPTIGSFILSHKNIRIPENPKTIYSCNEGNFALWDAPTKQFVDECKNAPKPYAARYVGSMVSDVHRTILYGGVFFYPADKKSKTGKLRMLYEAIPMSFIVEQAGGLSTNGTTRVLDLNPTHIHERTGIFLGCKRDVNRILALYAQQK